jgi:hypothetical protein
MPRSGGVRRIAEQDGKPLGTPQEYDAFHYEHQVPGGRAVGWPSSAVVRHTTCRVSSSTATRHPGRTRQGSALRCRWKPAPARHSAILRSRLDPDLPGRFAPSEDASVMHAPFLVHVIIDELALLRHAVSCRRPDSLPAVGYRAVRPCCPPSGVHGPALPGDPTPPPQSNHEPCSTRPPCSLRSERLAI